PKIATITVSSPRPARAPSAAGRQPRTVATASTIVKASTTSTRELRKAAEMAGAAVVQVSMAYGQLIFTASDMPDCPRTKLNSFSSDQNETAALRPPFTQKLPCCDRRSLRRNAYLGRGRAHVGVHVLLELHEVLLEHGDELARRLIELELVLPGLLRIEQMRLDAGQLRRHREAEVRIGAEFRVAQRAIERGGEQRARHLDRHAAADPVDAAGPPGVDEPAIGAVHADQLAQQIAVDRRMPRQEWRAEAGRELGLDA